MAHHHLLSNATRSCIFKSKLLSPPCLCQTIKRFSQNKEQDNHVIGEKARSTAEEFSRVAKEKAESMTETAKSTLQGAKEALVGESKPESESAKQKYKETVDKGKYDSMGEN
ncbi:hypothetical protein AQUCO_01200036v1 [Aquilegia coerulea]|uniref:Uncharacterized protein n=1 Tax=Aquilegia coerulea TaxID=218851 RepID=A0A2G5E4D7_AQUCA|nr:hypothetical protein AQUCO_01200036v1 [Aquilegia coerulea]